MITPTIHRNGTHPDDLIEGLSRCYRALMEAERIMENNGPNGRDYYPQGQHVIQQASAEWSALIGRVNAARKEVDELREHIDESRGTR